jgi:hypothetical protein
MAHTMSRRLLFASVGAAAMSLALTSRARRVVAEEAIGTFARIHGAGTAALHVSVAALPETTGQPGAIAPRPRTPTDSGQAMPQGERRNSGAG